MFFFTLPVVLIEILVFTTWTHFYEFWNVVFWYFAPSVLGALLLARSGQNMMGAFRGGFVPGQMPGNAFLHQASRVIGAIFLMIPLFLTRVLAVLLIVPGLRHLSIQFFKVYLFKRLSRSSFSFIKFGGPGAGGPFGGGGFGGTGSRGPFGGAGGWEPEERQERDATVVDITPLEITHGPSKRDPNSDPSKK